MSQLDTVDLIAAHLRRLRDFEGYRHVFVLVDPLIANTPLTDWIERLAPEKRWSLRNPQMRGDSYPCSELLLLDEHADDILVETIQIAGARETKDLQSLTNPAVCGWLFARGVPADISRHLIAAAQQRNAVFAPVTLRFADPRVMPHLNTILEPDQRQQLLGPVEHWFALDRFGCLSEMQTQTPAPYISTSLELNEAQWTCIEQLEAFNRTLEAYQQTTAMLLERGREVVLKAALARAGSRGIKDLADLITFGLYALHVHPLFDRHPVIEQALLEVDSTAQQLANRLETIPNQVWLDMAQIAPTMEQA